MDGSGSRSGLGGITFERESKKLRSTDKNAIRMLISYVRRYRWQFIPALLLMVLVALTNMAAPYLAKIAIDNYIVKKNLSGLNLVLLIYVAVYAIFWSASYAGSYLSHRVGHRMIADIRHNLYAHIVNLPVSFFTSSRTGETVSRLTGDVDNLSELISSGITDLFSDFLTIVGVSAIMFTMNVKLAAIVLLIIPIIFLGVMYI